MLTGCYNEDYKSEEQQNSTYIARNTRSIDIANDTWTNYDYCTIKGHSELIKAPWAENNVITTIPTGIRKDVKKEDGWDILFQALKLTITHSHTIIMKQTKVLIILFSIITLMDF